MASEPTVTEGTDEKERLEPEDLQDPGDVLASTHLHRYELAAELASGLRVLDLCCGTGYGTRLLAAAGASAHGVDVAADAIRTAEREPAGGASFERADALEFLRRAGAGAYDLVVCFEGIEHVPDPEGVADEMARLAEHGTRLLLSFPNSRGFEERNRFHVTDFGWEETQRLTQRFEGGVVLEQYQAEGSLIVAAGERPPSVSARLVGEADRDDPAWAGHWIVAVGFDDGVVEAASARLALAVAAHHHAYMRDLERANADLHRANTRLARAHLGVHDAAAASVARRMKELEDRATFMQSEARRWEGIADNNDWARRMVLAESRRGRYRLADAIVAPLARLPLLRRFAAGGFAAYRDAEERGTAALEASSGAESVPHLTRDAAPRPPHA